ncbi:MAG TPA: trypsin-like peptidase domain-containing protein [Cellulomonas sp.]
MTTTPEEPRPDEAAAPDEEAAPFGAAAADETASPDRTATTAEAVPATSPTEHDTVPLNVGDTAPLPPVAPAAVAPQAPAQPTPPVSPVVPAAPVSPAGPAAHPPYGVQPYAGPAYGAQPYAGQPAQPYAGQPAQPYAGPSYPAQYPGQQYGYGARPLGAGQPPYSGPSYPPAQPYAAQHPYGAPATASVGGAVAAGAVPPPPGVPGPDGAGSAPAPRKRRTWIPIVATLVVVVLLAAAAVAIATHRLHAGNDAASGPQATSIANIGQGNSGSVPVAGSTAQNPNWAAVAATVQGAVVAIDVQTTSGEALGSGVVVDTKGHVVTNNHVVEGLSGGTLKVTLSDGRIYDATVAGTDTSTDLAVVTIKDPPSDLTVAQFGDSDHVAVGDPVMAVGNPLGLSNTVTTGIVSAVNRPVTPQDPSISSSSANQPVTNAIQIDAAVNPGNSGGPLFDAQGQVIGITSSIATTSASSGSIGLGFAIPVNLVKNIAQQLIDNGSAQHAYLGVSLMSATATADGVTRLGAQVQEVSDGSPAAKAGLQVGDVIVAVNGQPVGGSDSLAAFVRAMAAGDKASLVLVRDGKSLTLDVTLATRPDSSSQAPATNGDSSNGSGSTGQGPANQNGSSGSGSSNTLPGNLQNMTPDQLWQWLQQQRQGQSQGQDSTPGSNLG